MIKNQLINWLLIIIFGFLCGGIVEVILANIRGNIDLDVIGGAQGWFLFGGIYGVVIAFLLLVGLSIIKYFKNNHGTQKRNR